VFSAAAAAATAASATSLVNAGPPPSVPTWARVWIAILRAVAQAGAAGIDELAVAAALDVRGLRGEAAELAGGNPHTVAPLLNGMGELEVDPARRLYRLSPSGGPLPPPVVLDILYGLLESAGPPGMLLSALGSRMKPALAGVGIAFAGRSLGQELLTVPGLAVSRAGPGGELRVRLACFEVAGM
jgi:hypothetical protein